MNISVFSLKKVHQEMFVLFGALDMSDFGRYTRANRRQVGTFESLIASTCSTK